MSKHTGVNTEIKHGVVISLHTRDCTDKGHHFNMIHQLLHGRSDMDRYSVQRSVWGKLEGCSHAGFSSVAQTGAFSADGFRL